MVNYQNGKIYRIVCNITKLQYIGSTCVSLSQRLGQHVSNFKTKDSGITSSKRIIEGGDYKIFLIENYPCDTKEELLMRERHFQENMECVNIYKAIRTEETEKEYMANYREEHKEDRKQYDKVRERPNRKDRYTCECGMEVLCECRKRHSETQFHINFVNGIPNLSTEDKAKARLLKTKEYNKEKYVCECGMEVTRNHKKRHESGKYHKDRLGL